MFCGLHRKFLKEEIWNSNKCLKYIKWQMLSGKCSWKFQSHLTLLIITIINNTNVNMQQWEIGGIRKLVHSWWVFKLIYPLWKWVWKFLKNQQMKNQKTRNKSTIWSRYSKHGYITKDFASDYRDSFSATLIDAMFIITGKLNKSTRPSTDKWVMKMRWRYTVEYYSFV